jgi:hypothetical protein
VAVNASGLETITKLVISNTDTDFTLMHAMAGDQCCVTLAVAFATICVIMASCPEQTARCPQMRAHFPCNPFIPGLAPYQEPQLSTYGMS